MSILTLQPSSLWHYFHALTQIPRPSFEEDAVREYVLNEGRRLGLEAEMDAAGNVLIRKPASEGCANGKGVILQSHLDMVAQKNNEVVHDFSKDPIRTRIEGDWVYACGTTLGADNGIGVAAMLAVLADKSLQHGALEALFTATEETGMYGAKGLQGGWLQGEILLNLDSEREAELCIGCAGGVDGEFVLPVVREAVNPSWQPYHLSISGLKGGHSGIDIDQQRGNANKLLVRVLDAFAQSAPLALASFKGGGLRNAIPREAEATFACPADIDALKAILEQEKHNIKREISKADHDYCLALSSAQITEKVLSLDSSAKALALVAALPNGVDSMSADFDNLVMTSSNLAAVELSDDKLTLQTLLRSADNAARDNLARRMSQVAQLAGASALFDGAYSGWQPQPEAEIIKIMQQTGLEQFGKAPSIGAIHAGLECGILSTHYPHWQMISFGPTIEMPHSPDERVHIASVARFYQWLGLSLEALADESSYTKPKK